MSAGQAENIESDEETTNLLYNFLIEKAKTAESPLKIKELCKEFLTETKSALTVNSLSTKIFEYRVKIHELESMDEETKIRMIFALSASVDSGFLLKIKESGDVQTDHARRITEYKKKGGGFELRGIHLCPHRLSQEREKKMLEFLAKKSQTTDYVLTDSTFITEFQNYSKTSVSLSILDSRYRAIKRHLHSSTHYADSTKVKMMFISGAVVSEKYLKKLEENAEVKLDSKNRITKYVANDKSLKLKGEHSLSAKRRSEMTHRINDTVDDAHESNEDDKERVKKDELTRSGRVSRKRVSSYGVLFDQNDLERKPLTSYIDVTNIAESISRKRPKTSEKSSEKTIKTEDTVNDDSNCNLGSDNVSISMNVELIKNEEVSSPSPINHQDISKDSGTESVDSKPDVQSRTLDCTGVKTIKTENNQDKRDVFTEQSQDWVSLQEFLKLLYSPVVTLDSVKLYIVQQKMKEKIKELRHQDEEVPIEVIRSSLESCLYIFTKSAELSATPEDTAPKLKDLVLILLMVTCYYDRSLYELQRKLRTLTNDPENQTKTVAMEKVLSAFETMLNIVCH
ncbi:hypothetical protein CRE_09086 [Caenorhabditis remanei]|uniref:Uncharacterized protein n=1 Tax=Caenorhabditis remanei TaxID=31234 RepID=E3LJ67_CAERE|nr:hypothetical protein CRE_09086 [Caenorhabditis remanei]